MIEFIRNNITRGDIIIMATLLLLITAMLILLYRKTAEQRRKLQERIGKIKGKITREWQWYSWQWERIRYPAKGHKFVRYPKADDMLAKMQRHYNDDDYKGYGFNAPKLSQREALQKSIVKQIDEPQKRGKGKKKPPPPGENDIPPDTGNHDIAQNLDFDYNTTFNIGSEEKDSND